MIKHLLVTSPERGRHATAGATQSSVTRELGVAQDESRKDRQRDTTEAAQQHAPRACANLMIALSETEMQKSQALHYKPLDRVKLNRL